MVRHRPPVFGPLIYRAQGYKRLKEDRDMATKSLFHRKIGKTVKYYVLSENVTAMRVSGNFEKHIQTLMLGSLVIVESVHDPKFVDVKVVDYENKYNIPEDILFRCPVSSLIPVNKTIWSLALAIPSPVDKVEFLKNKELCDQLCNLDVGNKVFIVPLSASCKTVFSITPAAVIKYRGPVAKMGPGIFFGVELLECFKECDTDGTFGGQRFFSCQPGRGMFVPINRLRLRPEYNTSAIGLPGSVLQMARSFERLSHSRSETHHSNSLDDHITTNKTVPKQRLNPGDRVVWCSESGPLYGTICWISHIDTTAHVHLDQAKNSCKVVSCDRSQSVALPCRELLTEPEYKGFQAKQSENSYRPSPEAKRRDFLANNEMNVADLLGIEEDGLSNGQTSHCAQSSVQNGSHEQDRDDDGGDDDDDDNRATEKEECEGTRASPQIERKVSNDENSEPFYDIADGMSNSSGEVEEFGVGSVVEVSVNGEAQYGVIRWIGSIMYGDKPTKPIAGIELEEENPVGCDGTLNGRRYFSCHPQKGFFTVLGQCRKDSRFQDQSRLPSADIKLEEDFGCPVIQGIVEPIEAIKKGASLFGKYRGIQGHNNSCYLDATLFSMFAFTNVLDSLLLRPANKNDNKNYEEVQRVLREEIVNPLRQNLFVRADRVMKLRMLLDNLTSVTGLTCEEKDPEEFLTSLVAQILKAEPFLKLSSGHEGYHYQLFVEKDEQLALPTVQQLFEQSFITSDIKLKEVPSCLIIQMPRFGRSYKMYPRILPSQVLDVTDVIENSPRQCTVCGSLATYECKECFNCYTDGLQGISFCSTCLKTAHSHQARVNHKWRKLLVPQEFTALHRSTSNVPRLYMELFAVVCIETSHYVTFAKCGMESDSPWCFFDSMADRTGGQNGYNIPEVVLCPDLPNWLSENGAQSLFNIKDERHLPEYAKRLLCDAYMCMYQSLDVMMYR